MNINFEETLKHKHCLNKFVNVTTTGNFRYEGWMKSLDPLSGDMLLVTLDDSETDIIKTTLIVADSCKRVEILETGNNVAMFNPTNKSPDISDTNLSELKLRLIEWIKKNLLPVEEKADGSLLVCESVIINPPYQPEDCVSNNARVLFKASEIIRSLPPKESVEIQLENAAKELITTRN